MEARGGGVCVRVRGVARVEVEASPDRLAGDGCLAQLVSNGWPVMAF